MAASVSWIVLSYSFRAMTRRASASLILLSLSVRMDRSFWIFASSPSCPLAGPDRGERGGNFLRGQTEPLHAHGARPVRRAGAGGHLQVHRARVPQGGQACRAAGKEVHVRELLAA